MKTDSGRFYCGSAHDRLASPVSKGIVRMSLQTLGSLTSQGPHHLYLPRSKDLLNIKSEFKDQFRKTWEAGGQAAKKENKL